ncbi:hypothetical protein JXQ70_16015, partial [bacterium]|nr:hypothetical protein [bacterium]
TNIGLTLGGGTQGLQASGSTYGIHAGGGTADVFLGGTDGVITAGTYSSSGLILNSNDSVEVHLDNNDDIAVTNFSIYDSADSAVFSISEDGDLACDGCIGDEDILDNSLTAAEVDPYGGIYSTKEALYVNTESIMLWQGYCGELNVTCNDANDLPLQGIFSLPGEIPNEIHTQESISDWTNNTSPAEYTVSVCNGSSGDVTISVSIVCITKN